MGNQVWNDFDGDGKRDDNEPGIGGVTVSLYTDNNSDNVPDGPAIRTTMSDQLGHYLFTNLTGGRYITSMPILPGYQKSPNNSTQNYSPYPDLNTNDTNKLVRLVGPNGPGGIVYSNAITLTAGQEPTNDGDDANGNLTMDLAECGNSFIGDFVWNDLNGNGIQDAGEPGINGVPVTITFEDGRTATTTTLTYNASNNSNAPQYDGYYNFQNLGPGTYKIAFATPAGLHASPPNQGGNDAKDSDPVNGGPVSVTIAVNQSDFTIDAGFTTVTPPPNHDTCHNNCNHTGCGHPNCAHNSCHNDCNHTGCGHPNCAHNSCHNDCNHTNCGHPNCGHNSCHNDCNHTGCGHANCGHSTNDGDCSGTTCTGGYFGGFEAGWYNFSASNGRTDLRNGLPGNGSFEIVKKASEASGGGYLNMYPHGGSNFMLIHTSSNATDKLWSAVVKVVPGKTYSFSMWVANAKTDPVNGFALTMNAGSKVIATANADFNWSKLSATYTVPEGVTSIEFSIKDPYPEMGASHFLALDDICVSTTNSSDCSKTVSALYPNPAASNFAFTLSAAKQGIAVISLVNMNGKTIFTEMKYVTPGANTVSIDRINNITGGTYNVQVIVDNHVYNQMLIISR